MEDKIKWNVAQRVSQKTIEDHREISWVLLQLLKNRAVFRSSSSVKKQKKDIEIFLNPKYSNLYDPFLLKGIKEAVKRIKKAVSSKEKVVIFGDYDADGVTASVLLYETLKFLGNEPDVYIPHRDKEGYGLNKKAIDILHSKKTNLIITVDCGIINHTEVDYANKLGIDVIITDHHEPQKKIPKALAVVNPKIKNSGYPFRMLAGVGVSFKLAQALAEKSKGKNAENFLKWLLDFVAIGSIGDIVPLIDENRILVKFGKIVFSKTKRAGLIELKKKAANGNSKAIDYFIAPRLNAAGRMDHANWAFKLLATQSRIEAFKMSRKIEDLNNKRRNLTDKIIAQSVLEIEPILPEEKIIILAHKDWSASVSGIVASRLVDEYNLPVLVIEKRRDISKGSARSPKDFDVIKLLRKGKKYFEKLGGHKNAAGFTYKTKNHESLVSFLLDEAKKSIIEKRKKEIFIDAELKLSDINEKFIKELEELNPFGEGNPEPIFILRNIEILAKKRVGGNSHLKLWIAQNGKKYEAIAFRKGHLEQDLIAGTKIDVLTRLGENNYRGIKSIQIEIIDIRIK